MFVDTMIVKTLTEVDLLLHNYVFNGYNALSDYLKAPLGIIASIYIVLFGYGIVSGFVKMQVSEFMRIVIKIGVIYMVVTQWSFVSEYLVGLINSGISGIGDALIGAAPIHMPGVDGIDGAMQQTLIIFNQLGAKVFDIGGISNIPALIDGAIIFAFGYLIVGVGLLEILLAKIMLAILFVFTPLMALFCFFKPMQNIFDKWLGAIIGFALMQLFVTAALALALSLAYWWTATGFVGHALHLGNPGTLPIIIIGLFCIALIIKAAHLAQNLGGIMSTSGGGALIGGVVGGAIGAGARGTKLLNKLTNGFNPFKKRGGDAGKNAASSMMSDVQADLQTGSSAASTASDSANSVAEATAVVSDSEK